jgi:Tol biopolymer transport system component
MVFLRYFTPHNRLDSAVFTANADGSDLHCLVPWGNEPSHFDWYSDEDLMVTVSREGGGRRYLLITDTADHGWADPTELGLGGGAGVLVTEGHPTFTPDRRYFAFDGPSDRGGSRPLRLYDMRGRREIELGRFHTAPHFKGDVRCDLHPRWNRGGTQVTFDSVHKGDRQVYAIDLDLSS